MEAEFIELIRNRIFWIKEHRKTPLFIVMNERDIMRFKKEIQKIVKYYPDGLRFEGIPIFKDEKESEIGYIDGRGRNLERRSLEKWKLNF